MSETIKSETVSWDCITHYAGFDWAKDHHDVVIPGVWLS